MEVSLGVLYANFKTIVEIVEPLSLFLVKFPRELKENLVVFFRCSRKKLSEKWFFMTQHIKQTCNVALYTVKPRSLEKLEKRKRIA